MIEFTQVTYTYPGTSRPALHNVNLALASGEFHLVAGASGAGKSTLLRCLNGLAPHFTGGSLQGNVRVNNLDPVACDTRQMSRHVGFVFQDPEAQFVMDRVEDEIAFALENAALPAQEMRVRVEETLDLLDLAELRTRPLHTLSGGEKQRVAIAAALALRPQTLVLDEPTSQLDPKSAEDVLNALVRLNADLGLTIVLAEHRLERLLAFADTLTWLPGAGAEIVSGAPRTVIAHMPMTPPLVTVARALQWTPLPLTIKEGLRFSRTVTPAVPTVPEDAPASANQTPTAVDNLLAVEKLTVRYGSRTALHDLSLRMDGGEVVVLLGRNGSGKSTLLRSIVGLQKIDRGVITVAGESIAGRSTADICRKVAYLPQDPNALLFADTVVEELQITLRNHGLPADAPEALRTIRALLERLRLADKMQAYPRDLSVGERQRVALAAVTIVQPRLLLLDEPTRGLDYEAKALLADLIHGWRSEGAAALVVTHDVEFAALLADRVVVLSQGEVIAQGAPADVLGASPLFAPQVARLFPGSGWLTADDVLKNL